ncbi:MAG TPA: c-type cytochrome [Bacteroidota bacterium]|nr:c-type cytochrome [Bacteroidota bacterium]
MAVKFFGKSTGFLIMAILAVGPARLAAQPGQEEAAPVKTAAEVQKNIQVFKTLPASQLDMVMDLMASSLGVRCGFCHVQDSTGWHYEKDDKLEKRKTRKMIEMVTDLNTKTFGGRSAVTCYTCHRGTTEPVEMIPIPPPSPKQRRSEEERTSYPAVESIMAKYEASLGGAEAIGKISSRVTKGKAVDAQGREMPQVISQLAPGNYLAVTTMREGVERSVGFDGATGWMSSPRGMRELPPDAAVELRNAAFLFPIQHMRELKKLLHVYGTDTVGGTGVFVLSAQLTRGITEKYYIDSTSGLLLRKVSTTDTPIGLIPEETDYSDYRAVDGVKVPYAVTTVAVDPHDGSTFRVESVEQNVHLDPKKFMMPPAKK